MFWFEGSSISACLHLGGAYLSAVEEALFSSACPVEVQNWGDAMLGNLLSRRAQAYEVTNSGSEEPAVELTEAQGPEAPWEDKRPNCHGGREGLGRLRAV